MKFNLPQPSPQPPIDPAVRIGNVYPCKGGGKTRYWVVLAITGSSVNLLGLNGDGQVSSTANYGIHVFNGANARELLGRCEGLDALEFDITWLTA